MNHAATAAKISTILERELGARVEVVDESHKHIGHEGAKLGGHFFVKVSSAKFQGLAPVARQRLVYETLGNLADLGVHALSMQCLVE